MKVSIHEICKFADTAPSYRSFRGGEDLLNVGFVIKCGKVQSSNSDSENHKILAFCNQTFHLKDPPHEINGEISKDGRIMGMQCTCKAGLSGACKHVVAVLLYCNRNDLEDLLIITCTDKKCAWNAPHKSLLEKYDAKPLKQHECFQELAKKTSKAQNKGKKNLNDDIEIDDGGKMELSKTQEDLFREFMVKNLPSSALAEHILGRHEIFETAKTDKFIIDATKIQALFDNQKSSQFLQNLKKFEVNPLQECCKRTISRLEKNAYVVCVESMQYYSVRLKERQFRITGSAACGISTYRKNKNPNREKKSLNYFYPRSVSNCYVKHGLECEKLARETYEKSILPQKVVETGLIVSQDNSWLGYSPDGVIFHHNKPLKLIEIKCPYDGKSKPLEEVLKSVKWLKKDEDKWFLREQHSYYAQVQIVEFSPDKAKELLDSLKESFFNRMIHYVCLKESKDAEEE